MTHIMLFSGGLGSWAAAKRVVARRGAADLKLLFTDTLCEDPDLYRFLHEAAENVGGELITLTEGRTPWQVFFDEGLIGNSQKDPCSRILKRELAAAWIEANYTPETCVRYVGIDWTEWGRFEKIKARMGAWSIEAPLCDSPYLTKPQIQDWAKCEGLTVPRLYALGFDHNNCGGRCVKAGQAHWAHLYNVLPCAYREWEDEEQRFRTEKGKDVSILKDRRGGESKPLSLRSFRKRLEAGDSFDTEEWGGCSCFAGPEVPA